MIRSALKFALLLALLALAVAQATAQAPDRRGEVALDVPAYQGTTAAAPIPREMHLRNEGGSNGAGLCVIASAVINGQYQAVPGLVDTPDAQGRAGKGSRLWQAAKRRPGGYSPGKLERLVSEVMPDEKWASYVGRDYTVLDRLSKQGYPIGATMNTGALYGYRPINHMVSLVHYRTGGLACVVDNNDPGKYHWMPAAEFDRRWIDGGTGWAWVWTRLPSRALAIALAPFALIGGAVAFVAGRLRALALEHSE